MDKPVDLEATARVLASEAKCREIQGCEDEATDALRVAVGLCAEVRALRAENKRLRAGRDALAGALRALADEGYRGPDATEAGEKLTQAYDTLRAHGGGR